MGASCRLASSRLRGHGRRQVLQVAVVAEPETSVEAREEEDGEDDDEDSHKDGDEDGPARHCNRNGRVNERPS